MQSLALLLLSSLFLSSLAQSLTSCADVTSSPDDSSHKGLLCQLAESSQLLAQLGILVNEGLERILQENGLTAQTEEGAEVNKRKHEYLRFGKRKHEYLRFGKRKHEYLRFGRK
ncbi:hypothetical protein PMAYCL1PPCAC_12472 [Pristionchus mayeri]|uniref:Uncharacterized protein n=1 Tax=Pristionchus mayeri TaxID=1317129 RepID=A0AAN4ZJ50_9BILA|nr:hypothetical protein PMAYCL1PPCAC_12472 [Pristionchus mayeri]